jgi:cell division protein ZapA
MGSSKENTQSTRVVIFGSEYSIKADVDVETTRKVARYVNSKMAELHENTASRDNVKIAVLSALNIAGELFELKDLRDTSAQQIDEITSKAASIVKKIDAAVKTCSALR